MTTTRYKKLLDNLLNVCSERFKTFDKNLITKSFDFAYEAHKNDLRASGEPYFDHPYEVAMILASEIPIDDITVAAGLLHDVIEDTSINTELLAREFGPTVAEIVEGVTKIGGFNPTADEKQVENYRKLLVSMIKDIRVIFVKFADRLHNMRTLEFLPKEKQERISKETLQIYVPFAHRLGFGRIKWELEDLAFKYLNPTAYEEIRRKLKETRRQREAYIKKVIEPIKKELTKEGVKFEIEGRAKHFYSIFRKLQTRVDSFDEIYDLIAIRIILDTDNVYDCYLVLGIITQLFTPIPGRIHDYIATPKMNNYQSLHTTVIGPDGKKIEIQIRTRKMHEIAERGVAAHWRYKGSYKPSDKELENWMDWIRAIVESLKTGESSPKEVLENLRVSLKLKDIHVFTPKGDIVILPEGATPVDFAFEIHSKVGFHCIGAKVNGKMVSLDYKLKSGDQVEIITSKAQTPNRSWEEFVVTTKAKAAIRRWIRQEDKKIVEEGKIIFSKALKKHKMNMGDEELQRIARKLKFENLQEFFKAIAGGKIDTERIFELTDEDEQKETLKSKIDEQEKIEFEKFAKDARQQIGGVLVEGDKMDVLHTYAKCCNPIPGDEILGFITKVEGLKIHRNTCKNLEKLASIHEGRVIRLTWPETDGNLFVAAIKIMGQDRPGMLSEISQTIVGVDKTNIRSVNLKTHRTIFVGTISLMVKDLEQLNKIIDRLRKIPGIEKVERFEMVN